jgi:hypothetical protein
VAEGSETELCLVKSMVKATAAIWFLKYSSSTTEMLRKSGEEMKCQLPELYCRKSLSSIMAIYHTEEEIDQTHRLLTHD